MSADDCTGEYLGRYTADIICTIGDHPGWSDEDVVAHVNDLNSGRGACVSLEEVQAERERFLG